MTELDSLSGATRLNRSDMDFYLTQYVKTRGLLKDDAFQSHGHREPRYKTDEELWNDVIRDQDIYESRRIFLEDFTILDWIPQSPGLYYTEGAAIARRGAQDFIIERNHETVVFDPHGKAKMIRGGIGCLRLAMKPVGGRELKFLCASKSGVAHKGFIIAMDSQQYKEVAPLIHKHGAIIASVLGELRYWQHDRNFLFYEEDIPRVYLLVEKVNVLGYVSRYGKLDVTAAVTFEGEVERRSGRYYTYSHFDPSRKESLSECINWLSINYVKNKYGGKVLTDFDELTSHFPDSHLPVKILMNPETSANDISNLILGNFGISSDSIVIEQLKIEGGIMSNITITGDGNVVGNNNQVVTTIHKGLTSAELRELGAAFALLKGEIIELQNVPDRVKNRAVRAVQDAEDEAADKNGDKNIVVDSLQRAKKVLEESGETYDTVKSWGKRLFDLGKIIAQYYPAIQTLITWL